MDKLEISGLPEDDPTLTPPSDNESSEKSRVSSDNESSEKSRVSSENESSEKNRVSAEDGDSGKKSGKKKKKSAGRYAAEFFIKIGVTALIIWALCSFVIGIYIVHGNSGYPMLKDGDLCIIYRWGELHQGDEVAYLQDGKIRFGRIVALPGNTVDLSEENLTVNGYGVFEDAVYPTTGEGALVGFPYEVPKDSYFILNDYRSDITDSRSYGAVSKKNIKGKVVFVMRRRGI